MSSKSPKKGTGKADKVYRGSKPSRSILGINVPNVRLTSLGTSTISLPSPPRMLFLMATYLFLAFLMAGGIFFMVREPPALGQRNNAPLYFWPSLNESFMIEGFIAAILLFVAGVGAIMLYQGSLKATDKTEAIRYIIIGLVLVVVAFGMLQYIIGIKTGQIS